MTLSAIPTIKTTAYLADSVLVLDALVGVDGSLGEVGGADGQPLLRLDGALLQQQQPPGQVTHLQVGLRAALLG